MIDATGWAERVKLAMYARMEELSFRSAVTTAAGVLALTGLGVTLTVTSGGGQHQADTPLGSAVVGAAPSTVPSAAAVFPPSAEPSPSVIPVSASPQARLTPAAQASSPATAEPPSLLSAPAATYTAQSPRSHRSPGSLWGRTRRSQPRLASGLAVGSARTGRTVTARPRTPAIQPPARLAGPGPAVGAAVLRGRR
jgi:hypothetical protein